MNTIYKYPIQITDEQEIRIPYDYEVIHAGLDPSGEPCIWVKVDTDFSDTRLSVFVVGTGNPIPSDASKYVGSFIKGPFVWHVFI